MSLGKSPTTEDAFRSRAEFWRGRLSPTSIYALLHRESHRLFPDTAFADLFCDIGRASVPPRIVSVVMVLQRLEGLSDRESGDRFSFDLRGSTQRAGSTLIIRGSCTTVLVDMRARLRRSEATGFASSRRRWRWRARQDRVAASVGLDSTPLYDRWRHRTR